jgi:hypothetical protein
VDKPAFFAGEPAVNDYARIAFAGHFHGRCKTLLFEFHVFSLPDLLKNKQNMEVRCKEACLHGAGRANRAGLCRTVMVLTLF